MIICKHVFTLKRKATGVLTRINAELSIIVFLVHFSKVENLQKRISHYQAYNKKKKKRRRSG